MSTPRITMPRTTEHLHWEYQKPPPDDGMVFLGIADTNGRGRFRVFPFWWGTLEEAGGEPRWFFLEDTGHVDWFEDRKDEPVGWTLIPQI